LKYSLTLLFYLIFSAGFTQKKSLNYIFPESREWYGSAYFKKKHAIPSVEFLPQELEKARFVLLEQGYFAAAVIPDTSTQNELINVQVMPGPRYQGIVVSASRDLSSWFEQYTHTNEKMQGRFQFTSPTRYAQVLKDIISLFQNNGYPFASYAFDSLIEVNQQLHINASLNLGRKMVWKEIVVKGDSSFSVTTLQQLIHIEPGALFSIDALRQIDSKLNQLSFVEVIKPAEFVFTKDGIILYLYVKAAKSSAINGVLGLQPNPVSQKISLTGDLQLKLNNTLKHAEQLDFNWRSIKPATQSMNLRFSYPYLFHSLLGTEFKFNLYKRDSTFLDLRSNVALQYQFANHWQLKGIFSYTGSNRLYAASSNLQFPNVTSLKQLMYGIGVNYKKLDFIPNPRKGLIIQLEGLVGQRVVLSDTSAKVLNSKIAIGIEQYIPLHKRWVARYALSFDSYNAPQVYSNECFRFGGLTSQRGFNEENFLATTKSINQFELRYLLDKNSSVFAFYDQTIYENNSNSTYRKDHPLGFGIGANIGSNIGIFSLVYAMGIENNSSFDARSGKIHFGYIAYF